MRVCLWRVPLANDAPLTKSCLSIVALSNCAFSLHIRLLILALALLAIALLLAYIYHVTLRTVSTDTLYASMIQYHKLPIRLSPSDCRLCNIDVLHSQRLVFYGTVS